MRGSNLPAAICVALALAACGGAPRTAALARGPDPVGAQTALRNWLECEECWDGELEALVAYGDAVVPSLAETLREGMSPAGRARLARQLGERYDERAAWAETHPETRLTMSREEYVSHHVRTRDALYRVRAARALGQIGTPAALLVLREELARTEHEGLREEIRRVLEERSAGLAPG